MRRVEEEPYILKRLVVGRSDFSDNIERHTEEMADQGDGMRPRWWR